MDPKMMKSAMQSVAQDMARAARAAKAKRFNKPTMMVLGDEVDGRPSIEDAMPPERGGMKADRPVDPVKEQMGDMSASEMDELLNGVQR